MLEFTGERVVPGQVDADLWNEHFARYLFAARLARGKRVIDLGCGAGYGSSELSRTAASVLGVDLAKDAVDWARTQYPQPNIRFEQASCDATPAEDASIDLAIAFEVIEHLEEPEKLLIEARRILAPGGQFIVSTPNIAYYAESRESAGPNPYHHHEFSFDEFREALSRYFPHVSLYTQNHTPAIAFQPAAGIAPASPVVRMEEVNDAAAIGAAHFYIAVCAQSPQVGTPSFFYIPSTGNVLREREKHIAQLESLLKKSIDEHATAVELCRTKDKEIEAANKWALSRDAEVSAAQAHITALDAELKKAGEILTARDVELEERTRWALDLDRRLQIAINSKWVRLGRKLNLGPDLNQ